MRCPECGHWIREEERYLMSADPDAELPLWARKALRLTLLFLVLFAVFEFARQAGLT